MQAPSSMSINQHTLQPSAPPHPVALNAGKNSGTAQSVPAQKSPTLKFAFGGLSMRGFTGVHYRAAEMTFTPSKLSIEIFRQLI